MKKAFVEKSAVVLLFVLVLVVFSFAERDTKKVFSQYGKSSGTSLAPAPTPIVDNSGPVAESFPESRYKTRN